MRFLTITLLACTLHAQPDRELFAGACGGCHGINGEGGQGPNIAAGHQVRRLTDQQLFHSIRNGVPGTGMPPSKFPDDQTWQLVRFVRSLSAPAADSAVAGDAAAGRAVFFGKGGCSGCHMIQGEGNFPGPDLSNAGGTRTIALLRQALLQPNARPRPDYRAVTATLKDGWEIQGVARSHSNYTVGILDSKGKMHLLSTQEVAKITFHKESMMPGDYAKRL
ncbi:MAG: c-type cytochrome, partial [Bryobacteraceae bacterium]